MKELPQYTLMDVMGWWATRSVPLPESACVTLKSLINNDPDFSLYIPYCAGIRMENSMGYISFLYGISNNQKFVNISKSIIIPLTLLNYVEMIYLNGRDLLTDQMATMILTVTSMTPEFSPYLTQLEGINGENSGKYINVIRELDNFALFKLNCQSFYLDEDKAVS